MQCLEFTVRNGDLPKLAGSWVGVKVRSFHTDGREMADDFRLDSESKKGVLWGFLLNNSVCIRLHCTRIMSDPRVPLDNRKEWCLRLHGAIGEITQRAADADLARIADMALDLAKDHRDSIW